MSTEDHTNGDAGRAGTVEPLACPRCARRFPLTERFCSDCEMPLVYVGRREEEPITDPEMRARRVRPEYASGALVKVASASSHAEAELIVGILLDQGIPARTADDLASSVFPTSSRAILVPESAYETARGLVADTAEHAVAPTQTGSAAKRLAIGMLVALGAGAALAWVLFEWVG
ncbi:MAG TPA: DUF2007 domain-containing protein [Solirubrobacterales bacterium]|nr:DUF2007 domain-containing protein [Solirubrobacterales bacterium]